MAFCHFSLH